MAHRVDIFLIWEVCEETVVKQGKAPSSGEAERDFDGLGTVLIGRVQRPGNGPPIQALVALKKKQSGFGERTPAWPGV